MNNSFYFRPCLVRAARLAARDRCRGERPFAALRAWRASARCEAALRDSRFSARVVALERVGLDRELRALVPFA